MVLETARPESAGQALVVEDAEGIRWRVECLGEAVSVGDEIVFEIIGKTAERRGEMIRLVEGQRREWVCRVVENKGRLELIPFGGVPMPPLTLNQSDSRGAQHGDRVVVTIPEARGTKSKTRRPRRSSRASACKVVEVLGPAGAPEADFRALAWKHRLPRVHARRARLEAAAIPDSIDRAEHARRLDLRSLPFITIDPSNAKDHDDAVFAETRTSGSLGVVGSDGGVREVARGTTWTSRLWVAIADVAHYVAHGSALDAEARRRANSFYFPDRAVAMLPERLSTEICSLVPDVDRLAMVVELRILADGRVGDALFHEAVIRSHARLSYEEAADWLDENPASREAGSRGERVKDSPVWLESLRLLARLTGGFFEARHSAGAVMLELSEVSIEVDETGRPIDARVRERNRAHFMIEESMLAANRAVASALDRAGRAALHRVHPPPQPAKLEALASQLAVWMPEAAIDLEDPRGLSRALDAARGRAFEERAHNAVLRSMSQARYESEAGGHYALRFEHYLHFTSPIRRYADLVVHRVLKRWLRGEDDADEAHEQNTRIAAWLSGRERVAMEVERESVALASCALLAGQEGERFLARVSSASEFGLFIGLVDPAVQGLIPIRTLDGYWTYDEDLDALIGDTSGARIGFGDELEVRLLEVDPDRARLAFERISPPSTKRSQEDPRKGRHRSRSKPKKQGAVGDRVDP